MQACAGEAEHESERISEFGIEEVDRPRARAGEAIARVTLTTICGTDLHIVRVVLLSDIASTGISGAEAGGVRIGDAVVVGDETRLRFARKMGADVVINHREQDVVAEVQRLTGGGADVAIEALGTQQTFESALRCLRPVTPMLTHSYALKDIREAYALFGDRRDGVIKVAIRP